MQGRAYVATMVVLAIVQREMVHPGLGPWAAGRTEGQSPGMFISVVGLAGWVLGAQRLRWGPRAWGGWWVRARNSAGACQVTSDHGPQTGGIPQDREGFHVVPPEVAWWELVTHRA